MMRQGLTVVNGKPPGLRRTLSIYPRIGRIEKIFADYLRISATSALSAGNGQ